MCLYVCVCVELGAEQGGIDLAGDKHLREPMTFLSALLTPLTSPGGCPKIPDTLGDSVAMSHVKSTLR